jgi:hypothetical protein
MKNQSEHGVDSGYRISAHAWNVMELGLGRRED